MPKGKTKPVFYSGLALSLDQPHTQIPLAHGQGALRQDRPSWNPRISSRL